jgi:hypothetical protein
MNPFGNVEAAINQTMGMEFQALQKSNSMQEYDAHIGDILQKIRLKVQEAAAGNMQLPSNNQQLMAQQMQMQQQQMLMQQAGFQQQQQQGMPMQQNISNPGQALLVNGMNMRPQQQQQQQAMAAPQAPMMQINRSQMGQMQHPNLAIPMSNTQQNVRMQPSQQGPGMPAQGIDPARIHEISQALIKKTQESGNMNALIQRLHNMDPQQKQNLISSQGGGFDLIQAHFRNQAMGFIKRQLQHEAAQRQNPGMQLNVAPNGPMMINPMAQQIPNPMPPSQQQLRLSQPASNVNSNNIDIAQFADQQANAQRQMEMGGDVVPASNHKLASGQLGPLSGLPNVAMTRSNQNGAPSQQVTNGPPIQGKKGKVSNTPVQTNVQPSSHGKVTPASNNVQLQAQAQAQQQAQQQARQIQANQAKSLSQQQLQGQVGGLHSSPQVQQQSPAMHMLQQPMQQPPMMGGPQMVMQQPQMMNNRIVPPPQNIQFPNQPQGQFQGLNVPQHLQSQLRALLERVPEHQRAEAMAAWQQQHSTRAMQAIAASQATTHTNGPTVRLPPAMPVQQMPGMDQQGTLPQQVGQQAGNQPNIVWDKMPLPKHVILDKLKVKLPDQMKTWHDLKSALRINPHLVPDIARPLLNTMQQNQFTALRRKQEIEAAQRPTSDQQGSQAPSAAPRDQTQAQGQPQSVSGMQELINRNIIEIVAGVPRIKEPTPQDIVDYRKRGGAKTAEASDAQMRELILSMKRKQILPIQQANPQLFNLIMSSHQQSGQSGQANMQMPQQAQGQIQRQQMQMQIPGGVGGSGGSGGSMPALLTPGIPGEMSQHLQHSGSSPGFIPAQPSRADLQPPNEQRPNVAQSLPAPQVPLNIPDKFPRPSQEVWQQWPPEKRAQYETQVRLHQMRKAQQEAGARFTHTPDAPPVVAPQLTPKETIQRYQKLKQEALASTHLGLPVPFPEAQREHVLRLHQYAMHKTMPLDDVCQKSLRYYPALEDTIKRVLISVSHAAEALWTRTNCM